MRELRYIGLLLIVFTSLSIDASAQAGTIRGFVYHASNSETMPYVSIYIDKDVKFGATTDNNGYFTISGVPIGSYTLFAKSLGFETVAVPVEITRKGQIVSKKLSMSETSISTQTVEITDTRPQVTDVSVSEITATPTIMGYVPTVGGEADIATYMQTLPGVVFTGDQGGQLYIRGGSPIQNKVLLDGMVIYNPFHSIGFFSVFDTDIIREADIYTGGFNAEYGSRISSVMDITTRDGNKKEHEGRTSVSPFMAKLSLEGPLKKDQGTGASISYLFSGKTSYLEQTSKVLYTPVEGIDSLGLPFNFTDVYGKISFHGGNGSKFNIFGFNYNDRVKYQAVQDFRWDSWGIGSNFILVPGNSPLLMMGNFSISEYGISLEEQVNNDTDASLPRSSKINGFSFGLGFKYYIGKDELKYGFDVNGYATKFAFYNAVRREISQNENTTELGGFFSYIMKKRLFLLEPGFRIQYYSSVDVISPEPRLGLKYMATDRLRFKAAGGMYSQNLISANSDRDIVNLFYGFLSGPNNLQDEFLTENGTEIPVTHSLQKANHAIFGFEFDLTDEIEINIETYKKWFTQLTNMNRNKIFDDNAANHARPDVLKKDFIVETGDAQGIDIVLKYQKDHRYFWAVYSLGKVNRWDGLMRYSPVFDRRHNINLVASYAFGKSKEKDKTGQPKEGVYKVTARWNLGSGLPFTQTQGHFELQNFQDGISTDYTTNNGELGTIYGELNGGRLPYYHRLDVDIHRTWTFKKTQLDAHFGITNVYNRKNIFYVNRITRERVDQLPVLPSVGVGFSW